MNIQDFDAEETNTLLYNPLNITLKHFLFLVTKQPTSGYDANAGKQKVTPWFNFDTGINSIQEQVRM